jgi:hypothetical protein
MKKISAAAVVLLIAALTLGMVGSATGAGSLTASKVKKIAKKQIAKAAPGLTVASANNSTTVGGKSVAQIQTVVAGTQNSSVVDIGGGTDVVTLNYTLAAPSRVLFQGVAELDGDGGTTAPGDEATCVIRNDGSTISLNYEVAFDDIGTDNPTAAVVLTSSSAVAAGAHIATMRCSTANGTGPITKDDAALNIIGVPN